MTEENIYLVDDNTNVLKTLSTVFKSAGFNVFAFSSAEKFAREKSFRTNAAIILDLRMPGISGLELLKLLKERELELPIIIYSAHADVDATVQAFSDGAFTLLQKPISNNLLIEKVRGAMRENTAKRPALAAQRAAIERLSSLSPREMEIAKLLTMGKSAPTIAAEIHISPRTVETHRLNLFKKVDVKSSAELAKLITLTELKV